MSGRAKRETSLRRWRSVWYKHERGMPNADIARALGVTENTVRYYLAKGRHPEVRARPATKRATTTPVVADDGCAVIPILRAAR
jgi:predicted transcriptional regulator